MYGRDRGYEPTGIGEGRAREERKEKRGFPRWWVMEKCAIFCNNSRKSQEFTSKESVGTLGVNGTGLIILSPPHTQSMQPKLCMPELTINTCTQKYLLELVSNCIIKDLVPNKRSDP